MIRIEKKSITNPLTLNFFKIISFFIGVFISTLVLKVFSINITDFLKDIFVDAFGSKYAISETFLKTIPLIICGIGVSLAFKMKLWNIGAEGQLYIGALGSTLVVLYYKTDSSFFMLSIMFLVAFILGGLWSSFAGLLKTKLNINEIIVTLLMNYIAILFINYLVYGPLKDPDGFNFPYSKKFPPQAALSTLFDTRLHTGIILAIILLIVYYILVERSIWGYEIRVIGSNPKAAKYAGININRNVMLMMFLSGGISALAGFTETAGVINRLQHSISPGYGYTAIIIAWMSGQKTFGIFLYSFFMAVIFIAGDTLQLNYQLPISMVNTFQGIILFVILISEFLLNHKISFKRRKDD